MDLDELEFPALRDRIHPQRIGVRSRARDPLRRRLTAAVSPTKPDRTSAVVARGTVASVVSENVLPVLSTTANGLAKHFETSGTAAILL